MAISLQKGKKVSLKKTQKELGEILVNLNWNRISGIAVWTKGYRPGSGVSV